MTRTCDQYGRIRITLPSVTTPGKTIEISEENWTRVGCPDTAEQAYSRIGGMKMDPPVDPLATVFLVKIQ